MDVEVFSKTFTHGMDEELKAGSHAHHILDDMDHPRTGGLDVPKPNPRKDEPSPLGRRHLFVVYTHFWYDCVLEARNYASRKKCRVCRSACLERTVCYHGYCYYYLDRKNIASAIWVDVNLSRNFRNVYDCTLAISRRGCSNGRSWTDDARLALGSHFRNNFWFNGD
eukprot:gb/GECG01010710.1/.p1 GENE.gb/GECG01010710.1/~~gb/GECG01010710.1/.p1  ORF type:complete len:167 (+),score=10.64 gb/GECG01010710.1/:1-501(+)